MKKPKNLTLKEYYNIYGISLCLNKGYEKELLSILLPIAKHYYQIFKYDIYQEIKHIFDKEAIKCYQCYFPYNIHNKLLFKKYKNILQKYNLKNKKNCYKLSYEQIIKIFNQPIWRSDYAGTKWIEIIKEFIKFDKILENPSLNDLIISLDRLNDICHNSGYLLKDFTSFHFYYYSKQKNTQSIFYILDQCSDNIKQIYFKQNNLIAQYH